MMMPGMDSKMIKTPGMIINLNPKAFEVCKIEEYHYDRKSDGEKQKMLDNIVNFKVV